MEFLTSFKANGHYSPAVISKGQVIVSGQLSIDPATGKVPETIRDEVFSCLNKIEGIIKEAGLDRNDIVSCRVYMTGVKHWDEVNDAYAEFFGAHKPARVAVPVAELHKGCNVEIEAVAELGSKIF